MVEMAVLGLFVAALFVCLGLGASILWALAAGFFLFFGYGLYRGHSVRAMWAMAWSGVRKVRVLRISFVLIGMIAASWRSAGTIAYIVSYATRVCSPGWMVLLTFVLCAAVSTLTGTAFGTSATVGVICATMANSMGIPILYTGGAVLAGVMVGDRCSPMSTSALLISSLTETDLFHNLKAMFKTAIVPLILSCGLFALLGRDFHGDYNAGQMEQLFRTAFQLHPAVLIPAAVIIVFSLFRVDLKITMAVSVLCGSVVSVWLQGIPVGELLHLLVFGYQPADPQVAALLSGGGIVSMVKVICIVCISSSFSGMFQGTGLLDGIQGAIGRLGAKITPYGGILVTASVASVVACNQSLAIMMTQQLCSKLESDPKRMMISLENTAVVTAALVPWSIAAAVPLNAVGAPGASVGLACYLYILPLWTWVAEIWNAKKAKAH